MPIDPDQLVRIRKFDRPAVEAMIVELYPQLHRIAAGLSGQEDVATGTIRYLLRQSLDVMPKWKDEDVPQRYYLHHLLLLLRRAGKHQPAAQRDLLVGDHYESPDYLAFVRALRKLPFQQREAFILNHGERLNVRYMAVAMDCSTSAAQNHLNSADTTLRAIAGDSFDRWTAMLASTYRQLQPPDEVAIPNVRAYLGKQIRRRRFQKSVQWIFLVALVAVAVYFAAVIWPILEF